MHMPIVSVIIPLFNKEHCIRNTINSVLAQTFEDFEVIVVDDGSTDKSLDVLMSIEDNRVYVYHKDHEGASATRNYGVDKASSGLIFFLDADDYLYPNCLEILVSLSTEFQEAQIWSANYENVKNKTSNVVLSHPDRGYVSDVLKKRWLRHWNIRPGSYMCTKYAFKKCGGFSKQVVIGEDELMADELISQNKSAYDPRVVMSYLWNNRSLSKTTLPPSKHMEFYIEFNELTEYRKLRMGELLGVCLINQFFRGRWFFVKDLLLKQCENIPFVMYAMIRRLFR